MEILDWQNILKPFNIYRPIQTSCDTYISKILYNNKTYSIQTTKLMIYSNPIKHNFSGYTLSLCCNDYKFNHIQKSFIKSIKNIEQFVKSSLPKLEKYSNINSSDFKSCIHINKNNTQAYLTVHLPFSNNCITTKIYDHTKLEKNIEYISPNSSCLNIITLQHIWFKNNKYGLHWNLNQSKIYHPIEKINECLILDDMDQEPILNYHHIPNKKQPDLDKYLSHPIFGKFIKMKQMGVPLEAIESKMKLQNLKIEDLNNFINHTFIPNHNSNTSVTANILKDFKLKRVKLSKKKKIPNSNQSFIPTEDELNHIISKLKSIRM